MFATSSVNFRQALLDEVALEGLDGITPATLRSRMSHRLGCDVTDSLERSFWRTLRETRSLKFHELPEPRPRVPIRDKFQNLDGTGTYLIDDDAEDVHPYRPVEDRNVFGSCQFYSTRKDVTESVTNITIEELREKWYDTMAIVADDESRWAALAPDVPFATRNAISKLQYCALEKIGRSRRNGELSHGRNSLSTIESDPKALFYINKSLERRRLAEKQHVNVKIGSNPGTVSILMHLIRFYSPKSKELHDKINFVEKYLNNRPGHVAELATIARLLSTTPKMLRRTLTRSSFVNRFEFIPKILYSEVFPDAPDDQAKLRNGLDRYVPGVRLSGRSDDDEQKEDDYVDQAISSFSINETLLEQTYRSIRKSKNDGLTMNELQAELGMDFGTTKFAKKHLGAHGLLYVNIVDQNRQRTAKYILNEFGQASEQVERELDKSKALLSEISNINDDETTGDGRVEAEAKSEETTNTAGEEFQAMIISSEPTKETTLIFPSLRKYRRKNIILEYLQKNRVTSNLSDIQKYICKIEAENKDNGGTVDKRSLKRLLDQMELDKQLKTFRVKVSIESLHTVLMFVCENSVDFRHQYIRSTIDAMKHKMKLKQSKVSVERKAYPPIKFDKKKSHLNNANPYPQLPKFSRLRTVHEFMFYLLYKHKNKAAECPPDVAEAIKNEKVFAEGLPVYYEDSMDKCIFVPPVDVSSYERPPGWILMSDLVSRLPLCIFSNVAYADINIPDILSYLKDPIRSQMLTTSLPDYIQYYLMLKQRHKFLIHRCIEQLALLGLVQFGDQVMKDKDKVYVYFNSNALLVDTKTSKPGYHIVEEKTYPTERFHFKTFEDVEAFWDRMFLICYNTRLGERYAALGTRVECEVPEVKMANYLAKRSPEEAVELDTGYLPGDGCGAGGFDSMLYTHLKRSWSLATRSTPIVRPRLERMPRKKLKKIVNKFQIQYQPSAVQKSAKVRIIMPRKKLRVRTIKMDDVDRRIMEQFGSKRCTWSNQEDLVIFLSRVAFYVMTANGRFSFIFAVRDILINVFRSVGKSSAAVRRRMTHMMRKPQNNRHLMITLGEVRRCDDIMTKYGNLTEKLKLQHGKNYDERDRVCAVRFVELVHLLYRRLLEKSIQSQLSVVLPESVEKVHEMYAIENPSVDTIKENDQDKNTLSSVRASVLSSIIHSAMWCSVCKENSSTFPLFNTYRKFPEALLRSTVSSLRYSGMISLRSLTEDQKMNAKRKFYNASLYKLSYSYFSQSTSLVPIKIHSQAYEYVTSLKIGAESDDHSTVNSGIVASLLELSIAPYARFKFVSGNVIMFSNPKSNEGAMECTDLELMNIDPNTATKHSFLLKPCEYKIILQCDLNETLGLSRKKVDDVLNGLILDSRVLARDICPISFDDELFNGVSLSRDICWFVYNKSEVGADYLSLKTEFLDSGRCSKSELYELLKGLMDKNIIRRMPHNSFRWVANCYLQHWTMDAVQCRNSTKKKPESDKNVHVMDVENTETAGNKRKHSESTETVTKKPRVEKNPEDDMETMEPSSDNIHLMKDADTSELKYLISPRPWIRPDGSLNRYVFFRWSAAILNYLMLCNPIIKLLDLKKQFTYLDLHHIQLLLEVLIDIGCVQYVHLEVRKPNLWSKNNPLETKKVVTNGFEDGNELYVELLPSAFLKFTMFKGSVAKTA